MIKLSVFLTRRDGTTHADFIDYWTKKHTPLLAELPPGAIRVSRYVQLEPLDHQIPGTTTSEYDGVAELWLDSFEDAESWFTSEAYTTTIAADEEHFLDRTKTRFLYADETVVFG